MAKRSKSSGGLAGTTLRIDLTTGRIERQPTDKKLMREWFGGRGAIAKILYDEVPRDADPFGPENLFIMNAGVMSGCFIPAGSKIEFGSISPLSNGHGDRVWRALWGRWGSLTRALSVLYSNEYNARGDNEADQLAHRRSNPHGFQEQDSRRQRDNDRGFKRGDQ